MTKIGSDVLNAARKIAPDEVTLGSSHILQLKWKIPKIQDRNAWLAGLSDDQLDQLSGEALVARFHSRAGERKKLDVLLGQIGSERSAREARRAPRVALSENPDIPRQL